MQTAQSLNLPQTEAVRFEKSLAYNKLKKKLFGIEGGEEHDEAALAEYDSLCELDLQVETARKISSSRYISFLDNVIVRVPGNARPDYHQSTPDGSTMSKREVSLRQYM